MGKSFKLVLAVGIAAGFVTISFQNCSPAKMNLNGSALSSSLTSSNSTLTADAPASFFGVKRVVRPTQSPTSMPASISPAALANLPASPETPKVKTPGVVIQPPPPDSPPTVCVGCNRALAPKLISVEYDKITKIFKITAQDVLDFDYLMVTTFSTQMVLQTYDLTAKPSLHGIAANLISQSGAIKTYTAKGTDFLVKNGESGGFRIYIEGGRVDSNATSNVIVITDAIGDNSVWPEIKCNKSTIQCGETFSCYAIGNNLFGTLVGIKPQNVDHYVQDDPPVLLAKNELVAAGWKKVNSSYYTYESPPINEPIDIVYGLSVDNKESNRGANTNILVKKCDQKPVAATCSVAIAGESRISLNKSILLAGSLNYSGSREGLKVKWIGTNKNMLNNYVVTLISEDVSNWEGAAYAFDDERYAGDYTRALQFIDKSGSIICTTNYISASFVK
ncbi:MAG: hypothetical protein WA160_16930 [Pseudobdellovibrio sp.]